MPELDSPRLEGTDVVVDVADLGQNLSSPSSPDPEPSSLEPVLLSISIGLNQTCRKHRGSAPHYLICMEDPLVVAKLRGSPSDVW